MPATQHVLSRSARTLLVLLTTGGTSFAQGPKAPAADSLIAPLPEKQATASLEPEPELFLPFSSIPGEPELKPDPVTDELRQMIDKALQEPLMGEPAPRPRPAPAPGGDPALLELATKTAGRVVGLRAWDGYGEELARGCGAFVSADGDVLADLSILYPEHTRSIEYITVLTGHGFRHRVTGFRWYDVRAGLVLLKTDAVETPFVTFNGTADLTQPTRVHILGLHEERGVVLADAVARKDGSQTGMGWLNLRGEDSPGEPGSPVIGANGEALGLVSMRVPTANWVNFALSAGAITASLEKALQLPVRTLDRLPAMAAIRMADDERFLSALRDVHEGRYSAAARQLLRLRELFPRSAEVWALLGLTCAKSGAREEAMNCNRKAVALDPEVGQYWYQLGIDHLSKRDGKDSATAIEALIRTTEDRPTDAAAWIMLAERQVLERQYREAEKSLLQVLKLRPGYTHALYLLGYTKGKLEDYAGAQIAIKECLTRDPRHTKAWFYLGLLYTKYQRFPEAAQALERTVELDPTHPAAWLNLAMLKKRMGKITDAALAHARHMKLQSVPAKPALR